MTRGVTVISAGMRLWVVDCWVCIVVVATSLQGRVKGLLCTEGSFIKYK